MLIVLEWSGSHHLPRGHADGLCGEFTATHVEEVFQARTEEVDDQNVV